MNTPAFPEPVKSFIEPTDKTINLVQAWSRADAAVDKAFARLEEARAKAAAARDELGKWLVPDNAAHGEEFTPWIGDGILRVKKMQREDGQEYLVTWRNEPSAACATRYRLT